VLLDDHEVDLPDAAWSGAYTEQTWCRTSYVPRRWS